MRSALRSPRILAGLGAGLGLLIACVAWFVPYLTRERVDVAGVPVPTPFVAQAPVEMDPGSEACLSDVAFDTDDELVELTALTTRRPPPRMEIVAHGPRYRETATIPGGYDPLTSLFARIDPPQRSVIGTLCVRNRGKRRVDLLGTTDARTAVGRSVTRIDGAEVAPDISVRLLSADNGSVLERLGQLVDRAAAFKPGLFGAPVFVWIVVLLAAIGAPAAVVYSMLSSFRDSD
jgi:hypothetical protein